MVGNRLKLLREELNLKQDELAKKLDVSPSAIGMYERDLREANDEIKIKMCKLFSCSMDYLTGNSDERNTVDVSKVQFANNGGLDTEGLTDRDIEELKAQIEFKRKYNKEKKGI